MGWWPWSKRVRPVVRFIRAKFDSAQTTPDNRRHWAKADAPAVDSVLTIDPVADMWAKAAAEEERIAAVRKVCGSDHADIAAKALREGWDVTRTELEVLRAHRPKVPAAHVVDNPPRRAVLEAACMLTARLTDAEKVHDEKTLDAASRRFRGGIGLQELLLEAAWANGYTGRNFRDSRGVLRFAFGSGLQAGFSTIDIGGILSNVSNKFLLEGFFSVERTWRNICAVRNVSDFKTVTSYRLIGKDQYEPVAPGGELKHGTLGEPKFTRLIDSASRRARASGTMNRVPVYLCGSTSMRST